MQLVRTAGPTEAMRRLGEVEGLEFERTSASRLDDDTWQPPTRPTRRWPRCGSRGLTAELVVPAAELGEQRATLFAALSVGHGRQSDPRREAELREPVDADGEGGIPPLPAIYPKIEREVHIALLALLSEAATA